MEYKSPDYLKKYSKENKVSPVIKWAGGKRQLLFDIEPMIPENFGTYFEPFFGGGALYFDLKPKNAVINDANLALINMYRQIKNTPSCIIEHLDMFENLYHDMDSMDEKAELYFSLRDRYNQMILSNEYDSMLAALFIFLNKTDFNGLYRCNKNGLFNVPFGKKEVVNLYNKDNIISVSKLLKNVAIMNTDFEEALRSAKSGDFVFFDSPYYGTFDTYQAGGFSVDDHVRLFDLFKKLTSEGVKCMLTNSNCGFIKDLYKDFNIKEVGVRRNINRNADGRTGSEVIVTNY